ncbi:class I SAM-dependent methyltransferase [Pelagibaculum spongiae]|uniref:Methyltransferase n=1 Tax=Pelagibaculum spongiae TaxID=2080658 RepID=A0A2V1GYE0_9GAMM|nr:class I SAM-dependent methyltransferase [Pelagibaculum spongiae]PVZ67755.1 hypothetical protein DC094_15080 [Pelagibaculum spongiae]
MNSCPLCHCTESSLFHTDLHPGPLPEQLREYLHCSQCSLIFVPSKFHLNSQQEKALYDLHQNDPFDLGYRKFLSRLSDPLLAQLEPNSKGLEFGCGPGPALAKMLEQAGHNISLYDLYYFPDSQLVDPLQQQYRFITATEVIEHLAQPEQVVKQLWSLLEAGGQLALMTKLATDQQAFSRWHYILDPTHICFYSRETFEWLAKKLGAGLEIIGNDVVILRKP